MPSLSSVNMGPPLELPLPLLAPNRGEQHGPPSMLTHAHNPALEGTPSSNQAWSGGK